MCVKAEFLEILLGNSVLYVYVPTCERVWDLDRSCDEATSPFLPNGFHLTNHIAETWLQISPLELGRFR